MPAGLLRDGLCWAAGPPTDIETLGLGFRRERPVELRPDVADEILLAGQETLLPKVDADFGDRGELAATGQPQRHLEDLDQDHWLVPLDDRRGQGAEREGMLEGFLSRKASKLAP